MKRLILLVLFTIPVNAQTDYTIMNFDKLMTGTDKIVYIQPPPGKYWVVMQGSTMTANTVDATFMLWLENAPYAPYRDPVTGQEMGCVRCATIEALDANTRTFFPIQGQSMPIIISYPNRLTLAITPTHGGLDVPLMTWTRMQVVERDLPQ